MKERKNAFIVINQSKEMIEYKNHLATDRQSSFSRRHVFVPACVCIVAAFFLFFFSLAFSLSLSLFLSFFLSLYILFFYQLILYACLREILSSKAKQPNTVTTVTNS